MAVVEVFVGCQFGTLISDSDLESPKMWRLFRRRMHLSKTRVDGWLMLTIMGLCTLRQDKPFPVSDRPG